MANNPYLSRLKKIADESGKLNEFVQALEALPKVDGKDYPSTADIKRVYSDLGMELPKMGARKLTDEEKQQMQEENDATLLGIFHNGTPNEKAQLMKIIEEHENEVEKEKQITAIKEAKAALKRLGLTEGQIKDL